MKKIKIISILSAITLQSCASPYVKPHIENRAYVELPTAQIILYRENGENCTDAKRFNDETNPLNRPDRTLIVPAGKRVSLAVGSLNYLGGCNVMLSFTLPKNGKYRIIDSMDEEYCYLRLVKLENGIEVNADDADVKHCSGSVNLSIH